MLAKLFGQTKKETSKVAASKAAPAAPLIIDEDGFRYASPAPLAKQWLAAPYDYPDHAKLGAHLAQVAQEGLGLAVGSGFLLSWEDVYAILAHPELSPFRVPLRFPPDSPMRPKLASTGALGDTSFSLRIDEWVNAQGRSARPAPKLVGKILRTGELEALLPRL